LVEAMNAGADDFIGKPFDQDELRVRIRAGQRIIDLTERLEKQAMTDPLTGLLNRRGLHDALASAHPQRDCSGGRGLGCVVADLDHFKQVNDHYGHAAGDLILQQTALRLRTVFEPQGIVARMGGEEFWIILCDCDHDTLAHRVEAARARLAAEPFELPASTPGATGQSIKLTASFGFNHVTELGEQRLEQVFAGADRALYQAKSDGRNCVRGAPPDSPDSP
jgi:diguanylate cyclase (GGDEF)-like protein